MKRMARQSCQLGHENELLMIEDYSQGSRAKTKTKRKLRDFNFPFIVIHDGLRRVLVKANKKLSVDYAL